MRQDAPLVAAGDELHAAIQAVDRLQRHPQTDFLVVESRVLKRLVLVPGRGRAVDRRLHEGVVNVEPRLWSQDLPRQRGRVAAEFAARQLAGKVLRTDDLRDVRGVRVFLGTREVEVRPLIVARLRAKQVRDDLPQFADLLVRGDPRHGHEAVLAQKGKSILAQQRAGMQDTFGHEMLERSGSRAIFIGFMRFEQASAHGTNIFERGGTTNRGTANFRRRP